eukprot:UN26912
MSRKKQVLNIAQKQNPDFVQLDTKFENVIKNNTPEDAKKSALFLKTVIKNLLKA